MDTIAVGIDFSKSSLAAMRLAGHIAKRANADLCIIWVETIEKDRDEAIEELYQQLEKECTEEGKKLLFKYTDEMVYRESEDADFYYRSGFFDGVELVEQLQKLIK